MLEIFALIMNHWSLLPVQTCCFSAKIECGRKWLGLKFCLLFKTRFQQYCTQVSYKKIMTNSCSLHRNISWNRACLIAFNGKTKTKFGMIKVIFTSGGRCKWLIVVSFQVQIFMQCLLYWLLGIIIPLSLLTDQKLWSLQKDIGLCKYVG